MMDSYQEKVPSYDEAVGGSSAGLSPAERILQLQQRRISFLLCELIEPFINNQIVTGLSKGALIVVPADIESLWQGLGAGGCSVVEKVSGHDNENDDKEQILGFPDDEFVKLVRLDDTAPSLAFWQQPQIVSRLQSSLQQQYGMLPPPLSPPVSPSAEKRPAKRGFWSRTTSSSSIASTSSPWDANGMSSLGAAMARNAVDRELVPGQMSVAVSVEEVSLRTIAEFGLFEVRTGRTLVVRVRIGT